MRFLRSLFNVLFCIFFVCARLPHSQPAHRIFALTRQATKTPRFFFAFVRRACFFAPVCALNPPHHILSYIHRAPNALARHAFFCLRPLATLSATRTAFFVRAIRAVYPPYFLRLLPRAKCACAFCSLIICAPLFAR